MPKGFVIRLDGSEDKIKQKRKTPTPYVQPQWITDYMRDRDRLIYMDPKTDNQSKQQILERWT